MDYNGWISDRNTLISIATQTSIQTLADLIEDLGVSPDRILMHPPPGTATVQDVIGYDDHHDWLVELVDGVLVEKAMGFEESIVALVIARLLGEHIKGRKLGVVAGSTAWLRFCLISRRK